MVSDPVASKVWQMNVFAKRMQMAVVAVLLPLLTVFAYNKVKLQEEAPLLERPLGQMVEVDGHRMCVYAQGEGEHTLVFLSGSGTASPILDFKSLYSLLQDEYRIVVIEKFGYGFSDVVSSERPFDTILRQDREALAAIGVSGPYVLCPHSMSGLEAILWAQKHPSEVEAIVGLDMALPRSYDEFDFEGTLRLERLAALGRELGVVRFFYGDGSLPEGLSDDEKRLYRAIACRAAVNETIVNEGLAVPDACREIDAGGKPDVPMLMFTSDGSQTRADNWIELQHDYAAGLSNASVVELDCGHYVHNFEQERIASGIREFLGSL